MNSVSINQNKNTVKIEVKTLDELLKNINPTFIKIDVEGYEYNVIKGAKQVFSNSSLKYLLVEFNNSGGKFKFNDDDVYRMILDYDFIPINYNVDMKTISVINSYNVHKFNTLFIRKNLA